MLKNAVQCMSTSHAKAAVKRVKREMARSIPSTRFYKGTYLRIAVIAALYSNGDLGL